MVKNEIVMQCLKTGQAIAWLAWPAPTPLIRFDRVEFLICGRVDDGDELNQLHTL